MPDKTRHFLVGSLAETEALARRIAEVARPGDVIALHGPMGAGKSVFAREFIRHRAQEPTLHVPSPTFALVQSYALTSGRIAHYDLWRLTDPGALHELGWEDETPAISLVEWPENAGAFLPSSALHIYLSEEEGGGEDNFESWAEDAARRVTLVGWAERPL